MGVSIPKYQVGRKTLAKVQEGHGRCEGGDRKARR